MSELYTLYFQLHSSMTRINQNYLFCGLNLNVKYKNACFQDFDLEISPSAGSIYENNAKSAVSSVKLKNIFVPTPLEGEELYTQMLFFIPFFADRYNDRREL